MLQIQNPCRQLRTSVARWVLAALLSMAGCVTNPVTQSSDFVLMSEEQELAVGRNMAPDIEKQYGLYPVGELQAYVGRVGKHLAERCDRPDLFYHFAVLDSPLVNAFALPGGYVYITRGLLAHLNSEAELAGVLGHEIGHVAARHAVRQYTKAASYQIGLGLASIFVPAASRYAQLSDLVFAAISSGYSREYEREADRLAVAYSIRTGYDPQATSALLHTLELLDRYEHGPEAYTSLFATHPQTGERIEEVARLVAQERRPGGGALTIGRSEYLQRIDGLLYGADAAEGVVIGNRFQHPVLRIELLFPQHWKIDNRPDAVIAKAPAMDASIELRVHHLLKRQTIEEAAAAIAKNLALTKVAGQLRTIHGTSAYVGRYVGRSRSLGAFTAEAGFFLQEDRVYCVMGMARPQDFSRALALLQTSIESFRELGPQEAAAIQPCRIRRHHVAAGETLASILAARGCSPEDVRTSALLNGWDPGQLPLLAPGMLVKVLANR